MRYQPVQRTLEIEFRDGRGVYRYFDVPAAEWRIFRASPSKGTYLNRIFKDGGYGYERIGGAFRSSPQEDELVWGEEHTPP